MLPLLIKLEESVRLMGSQANQKLIKRLVGIPNPWIGFKEACFHVFFKCCLFYYNRRCVWLFRPYIIPLLQVISPGIHPC